MQDFSKIDRQIADSQAKGEQAIGWMLGQTIQGGGKYALNMMFPLANTNKKLRFSLTAVAIEVEE
jgi:hypothetical protein